MTLEVVDAQQQGMTRPLLSTGLDLGTKSCVVFFNTRPEDGLTQFFAGISQGDMPLLLRAIAVHEVAHCIEQREAYGRRRFGKVLPESFPHHDMTLQGYSSVVKSGAVETWGEALADISSLLYLKRTVPEQWLDLARRISAMRRELAGKWPRHDTTAWLDQVIAADPDTHDQRGLFEAAFQYRRQFAPGESAQVHHDSGTRRSAGFSGAMSVPDRQAIDAMPAGAGKDALASWSGQFGPGAPSRCTSSSVFATASALPCCSVWSALNNSARRHSLRLGAGDPWVRRGWAVAAGANRSCRRLPADGHGGDDQARA